MKAPPCRSGRLTERELDAHIAERMTPLQMYDVERESPWLYLLIAIAAVLAGAFGPIVYDWIWGYVA